MNNSKEDIIWSKSIRERDRVCQLGICQKPAKEAHHWINSRGIKATRHDLNNGIGVCHTCHIKIHNKNLKPPKTMFKRYISIEEIKRLKKTKGANNE